MTEKLSEKDKKDWHKFVNSEDKLEIKDNEFLKQDRVNEKSIDLHGFTLDEANDKIFKFISYCYQNKVKKIVLIDVPIPGDGSADFSENRWHHQFHKIIDLPEELTIDREEIYLNYFYNNWSGKNFVMEKDAKKKYLDAYANKNAMKSGFEYYRALPQDIKDNLKFLKKGKLNIPFLGIAGGEGYGRGIEIILKSLKRVTNNYEGYEISNCGHWVAEEEPELISKYIIKFFNKK